MSTTTATIDPERQMLGEVEVIGRDRWEEIRRRAGEGASIRAIARALDLDRKTVRRCLRQREWKPYQRAPRVDTLLATHAEYLRGRAAEVGYSAQVLFQELRRREYCGSYETDFGDRVIASAILDGSCITRRRSASGAIRIG